MHRPNGRSRRRTRLVPVTSRTDWTAIGVVTALALATVYLHP